MGFLDRFSGIKDRIGFNKDFDINESLAAYYGDKNIKESYLEITKITKKKFKETYDISDELLEKYAKINNNDIQNSLMKKYLKYLLDVLVLLGLIIFWHDRVIEELTKRFNI